MKYFFQRGQALPLGLVLLVAVAATVFFMFNSGQLVQEKIRLTNTADAVAYSAGVYEARVLNYDAYTNRAMIANEIAIGQAVGLASWTKYAGIAADNIADYVRWIPYVGAAIAEALEAFASYVDIYTFALSIPVLAHSAVIQALSASQYAVHGPGNAIALANRLSVMKKITKMNDPDAEVDLIPLADNLMGFTQRYESQEERKRMAQLVNEDRDAFLRRRGWDTLRFPCLPQLRKRGSTELVEQDEGWDWKSMDTLSAHVRRIRFVCRGYEYPIGYATANTNDDLDDSDYSYAGSRNVNPRASQKADDTVTEGFDPATRIGDAIPPFYELSENTLKEMSKDPRATITIRVTKDAAKQRYTGGASIIKPTGRLDLYAGNHARGISAATSSVEVYFERPDGNNQLTGKEEYGSLFNPYWQVRLAPVSGATRALAQGLQGRLIP